MKVPSSLSRSTRQHKCNPSDVGVYRGVRVLYIKDPPPEVTDVRDKLFADGVRKSGQSLDKTTFLRVDDEKNDDDERVLSRVEPSRVRVVLFD